jgi:hypothetical protein
MPVVANIDADPHAEILMTALDDAWSPWNVMAAYEVVSSCTPRPVWNQATYHVTNVADDGTVPRVEAAPWERGAGWGAQVPAAPVSRGGFGWIEATAEQEACAPVVSVRWEAAALDGSVSVVYDVWRSSGATPSACCTREGAELLATSLVVTEWTDASALEGAWHGYLVEARLATGGACAMDRLCSEPTWLAEDVFTPAPAGPVLRVSHVGHVVTADWRRVRPLQPGEHFHLLKSVVTAVGPWVQVLPEDTTDLAATDVDSAALLQFFDLRIADACEAVSDN